MVILEVIFPVFAIVFGGYVVARWQLLTLADVNSLSRFVYIVAFPVLLFYSFATVELPAQINWKFIFAYYLVALSTYSLGILIKKYRFGGLPTDQVTFGLGASFSNLLLVGLPIISSAFGEESLLPLFMIASIHSAILLSLSSILIERGTLEKNLSGKDILLKTLKGIFHNPIILSLLLGLVFNLTHITFPEPINKTLDIFSKAALPCALFTLGASLNEHEIAGELKEAGIIVGLKMILQPLLVSVIVFIIFDLDPLWGNVAVLAAGMPIGINTYLFAQSYQANTKTLSAAILLSTMIAVVTQSIMLSIFI